MGSISKAVRDSVVGDYHSGLSIAEIMGKYSVSSGSVSNILKQAGVVRERRKPSGYPADLSGLTFGRLVVLQEEPTCTPAKHYRCLCECGRETVVRQGCLVSGKTKSCGCLQKAIASEILAQRNRDVATHNKTNSYIYNVWRALVQRCTCSTSKDYPNWGGRGITVHSDWLERPELFFRYIEENLGDRPTCKHFLDRIDNDKGYQPGNLRWATPTESARNRRGLTAITFRGETKTVAEWAEIGRAEGNKDLTAVNLHRRLIDMKWPVEKALTTPVKKRK